MRPSWTFPVEDSREITATLDGRSVPVQIATDGRTGSVLLDGLGRHGDPSRTLLQIRRIVGLRHESSEDVLSLAINPMASAQVVVEEVFPDRPQIERPQRPRTHRTA